MKSIAEILPKIQKTQRENIKKAGAVLARSIDSKWRVIREYARSLSSRTP